MKEEKLIKEFTVIDKKTKNTYGVFVDMDTIDDDEPNMIYFDNQKECDVKSIEVIDDDVMFKQWIYDLETGKETDRGNYTLQCICSYNDDCIWLKWRK